MTIHTNIGGVATAVYVYTQIRLERSAQVRCSTTVLPSGRAVYEHVYVGTEVSKCQCACASDEVGD